MAVAKLCGNLALNFFLSTITFFKALRSKGDVVTLYLTDELLIADGSETATEAIVPMRSMIRIVDIVFRAILYRLFEFVFFQSSKNSKS